MSSLVLELLSLLHVIILISPCCRIHAVTVVSKNVEYIYQRIQKHLDELKVQASSRDLVNVIGGYVGEGYGKCTEEDLSKTRCSAG